MINLSLLKLAVEKPSTYCIKEAVIKLANKEVYIYGAGSFGEEICFLLKKYDIQIRAFFDNNASQIQKKQGIKVYKLEDAIMADKINAIVVFAVVMDKEERRTIMNSITNSGYKNVIEAQSLRCLLVDFNKQIGIDTFEYIKTQEKNIYAAIDLFEDGRSKEIYICNVYSHLTKDYSKCETFESSMKEQYFPEDIHLNKGYAHFIDCGGYIGDTVLRLINNPDVKSIISFEPNLDNFKKLSDVCDNINSNGCVKITLFPCAVSNKVGLTSFAGAGGSGAITESGDNMIQSIALDKVLKNLSVTFIKMDIEGEELNALYGAKHIIETQKPDLAICVYHCIDHLWEIPLFLKKTNPAYQFYLRSYNAYTMETVLYATCDIQENLQ